MTNWCPAVQGVGSCICSQAKALPHLGHGESMWSIAVKTKPRPSPSSASSVPQVVDLVGCSLGRQPDCLSSKDLSISRSNFELDSCSAVQAAALASCSLDSQSLGLSAQSQPTHNATHLLPHCAGGGGGYGGREEANPFEAADKSRAEADNLFSNDNTGIDFDAYDDIPVEATGNDVPAAINTFADVDLGEALAVNVSFQAPKASCMPHCACCVPDGGFR